MIQRPRRGLGEEDVSLPLDRKVLAVRRNPTQAAQSAVCAIGLLQ